MKKLIALLVSSLIVLFGCSGSTAEEGVVTIWAWDQNLAALEAAEAAYVEAYPDSEVTFDVQNVPDTVTKVDLYLSTGTGEIPDIVLADNKQIASWLQLYPEEFVNMSEMGYDEHKDEFSEGHWDLLSKDDSIYAAPFDVAPVGMVYNTDIANEIGVNPDEITTWEEFNTACQTAMDAGYMCTSTYYTPFVEMLRTQGLSMVDEEGNIDVTNPEVVAVAEQAEALLNSGAFDPAGEQNAFNNGKALANTSPAWLVGEEMATYEELGLNLHMTPMPAVEEGGNNSYSDGGSSWVIMADSDMIQASYDFLEILTTTAAPQQAAFDAGLMPGWIPATTEVEGMDAEVAAFGGQQVWLDFAEYNSTLLPYNVTQYYSKEYEVQQNIFQDQAISTDKSAEALMQEVADTLANSTGLTVNQY